MIVTEINKNLLDSDAQIICHQVNCMGAMGSGVAKGIKQKWPEVFREYQESVRILGGDCLGGCLLVPIDSGKRAVANLFAQYFYNGFYKNSEDYLKHDFWQTPEMTSDCIPVRFTNYEAFWTSLRRLRERISEVEYSSGTPITKIAFPYNIGCCRGGGSWNIIYTMIKEAFKDTNIEVEICRL